ncbi:unnamed protein product [Paramecium primaurelia]|uniref:Uncharacterized protein n=2 Tax=Paramecium TaxID=5884 RepID=A0A8S1SPJ7_9CILI|nr:unnamed protein product [Paramecium primaurelia]CAD8141728.1 unnamed protein product [Paramecium pentaurelia]
MHKPYKGLIDPSGYNYGGQSLMFFEKYNHREYLNKVKAWPLNHMKYMESEYPIQESKYQPYKNPLIDEKIALVKPKNEIIPENKPRFFRRVQSSIDPGLQQTRYQPNQMWPKHKKYREKTSGQYLQYLNPKNDPYGHKESKIRTKNDRKGLSYASNLMNFSFKEETILQEFDKLFQRQINSGERITIEIIQSIVIQLGQQFNIKSLDTFSKLFNHIQKQGQLSIQDFQQMYTNVLHHLN